MKIFSLTLFAFAFLLISSCGDSPEKLLKDQASYFEEITEILDDVAEGKISSADAAEEIKKWGKKGDAIQERMIKLRAEEGADEAFEAAQKNNQEMLKEKSKAFFAVIAKLEKSGRMTHEIRDAMMNVKSH